MFFQTDVVSQYCSQDIPHAPLDPHPWFTTHQSCLSLCGRPPPPTSYCCHHLPESSGPKPGAIYLWFLLLFPVTINLCVASFQYPESDHSPFLQHCCLSTGKHRILPGLWSQPLNRSPVFLLWIPSLISTQQWERPFQNAGITTLPQLPITLREP